MYITTTKVTKRKSTLQLGDIHNSQQRGQISTSHKTQSNDFGAKTKQLNILISIIFSC